MSDRPSLSTLEQTAPCVDRHIGPRDPDVESMLAVTGFGTLDDLLHAAVPDDIRTDADLHLPEPLSEADALATLRRYAASNRALEPMIGLGYYSTITPAVIRRNVLENPSWYTAYTPYQPEISQGRLEALLNFQTMVADLTGLPTANSSLLDEATAAAEAMTLVRRADKSKASGAFVVDSDALPQTISVICTRAEAMGIEVIVHELQRGLPRTDIAGVLIQYPGASGHIPDLPRLIEAAHDAGAMAVVAADLLSLTLLSSPGELGADVAIGSTQRFGVPLFYGGPHAGYMAVRAGLERQLPGRLVGVSVDVGGRPAYRLALQTREQHIRRDKATSNICTAQVLLAVAASMYAVHHGPAGLRDIAYRIHRNAAVLAQGLRGGGFSLASEAFFDTVVVNAPGRAKQIVGAAHDAGIHLRLVDADRVGISTGETTGRSHLEAIWAAFGLHDIDLDDADAAAGDALPEALLRTSTYLNHEVFHAHRSETALLRYLKRLADRDYALDRGMIPLGSCTMKLNAAAELEPISWPAFANLHPFAPASDAEGYRAVIEQLERWLAEATGYAKVSLQPNAGSQGELAGLIAIRRYHEAKGEPQRDVCLIPSSAHGTNAASAVMAGLRVVVVRAAHDGAVDLDDLAAKCEQHDHDLAALMVTYPSTHGAYEDTITPAGELVHQHGGQVYLDGANLNALLGLAKPGRFGGDVSHLNLHKTFCIPHGGGGPGVGPVAVAEQLAPYLPTHPLHPHDGRRNGIGAISAAPYGSAGILPISWAYIAMMGASGLTRATELAVLSANYLAKRLAEHFPVLYRGNGGLVAHECILDVRPLTKATGVTVDDIAKRLIDYGFHAPTVSFPVAGTLMVEPTESEDLTELDRFCDAMIAIRSEIDAVACGEIALKDSPLRNAPHTSRVIVGEWDRSYSREQAAFPAGWRRDKYWPPVGRIDQAYGDRHLVCSCPAPTAFEG